MECGKVRHEQERISEFACSVKNLTHAIRLLVPLGVMEGADKISPRVLADLFRRNREKHCADLTDEYPPGEGGDPEDDDSPLGDPEDKL
jgi:hypothetical protein